jgi:hypothetical protein
MDILTVPTFIGWPKAATDKRTAVRTNVALIVFPFLLPAQFAFERDSIRKLDFCGSSAHQFFLVLLSILREMDGLHVLARY